MIVVDGSAILEVLLNTPRAPRISERLFARAETLCAPHLLDLEVAQALRRNHLSGKLSAERGLQALEDFADIQLRRYRHDALLLRIWELRHSVTAYDAAYLALAEGLRVPLITCDKALASSVGHAAEVELI